MDFLNEFTKKVSSMARSVTEKSKEGAELSRLNAELRGATDELERLYARYGRWCYENRQGGGDAEEARQLELRIRAAEMQVEEMTDRRDAAREMKRCIGCGAVYPVQARFCCNCGRRLPEGTPRPEPMAPGEYCPVCGAVLEAGDARCPVCGAEWDGEEQAPQTPAAPAADEPVEQIEEPANMDDADWE